LIKSQTVLAPNGTARVMPGSIITYQIEARFPLPVRAPEITDAIPDGLDFVPGSMTLDGQLLTDATGDDAGSFDGRAISVRLGDQAAAGTRIVRFQTKIR
ncbi:MAG: isopeptide-forming domain-containing fimbrial protein, partial [Rhizorhabdus sp.]